MNLTDITTIGPENSCRHIVPEAKDADYVEMAYLSLAFMTGAPLNLIALTKLNERRKNQGMTRLLLLKFHLNFTDILVIFVYAASRFCWLMTYRWQGGPILCPIIRYLYSMSFYISSFVIVCIAMDRLGTVFFPGSHTGAAGCRNVKFMLAVSWLLALVGGIPQLLVWRTYTPYEEIPFTQCMTIWQIRLFKAWCAPVQDKEEIMKYPYPTQKLYLLAHTISTFWLPAAIAILCYTMILGWVCCNLRRRSLFYDCCDKNKFKKPNNDYRSRNQSTASRDAALGNSSEVTKSRFGLTTIVSCTTAAAENSPKFCLKSNAVCASPKSLTATLNPIPYTIPEPSAAINGSFTGGSLPEDATANYSGSGVLKKRQSHGTLSTSEERSRLNSHALSLSRGSDPAVALLKAKKKIFRSTLVIVAVYIVFWIPYNVLSLLAIFDRKNYTKVESDVYFLYGLIIFNSVLNPFIYGGVFSCKSCKAWRYQRKRKRIPKHPPPTVAIIPDND